MSKPHERARRLVQLARADAVSPDNAPAVVNALLTVRREEAFADEELMTLVLSKGWNQLVREVLSRHFRDDDTAPPRAAQLALWPEEQRSTVEQIDRERVFVPSRGDFVELVPDALTAAELREAGEYLLVHGRDTIRRGEALIRLAQMQSPEADAA
ncbi:hypothetical protein [Roseomonas chloroacetimidivorans]|uniref:hypothetical protein n=1 Tax=Roseomonas chloroacetimidivorans TaxID=1766656 RepID=UPI003C748310